MQRVIFSLLIFLVSYTSFSQQKYVTEEEFNEKISWLEVHETHLYLKDVLRKVPGATNSTNNWLVDGILYTSSPPMLYASQIKYIEVVNNILQGNMCQCNLIVKTIVTEKELDSRKNILNRLNKNIVEEPKKKKKKKKKKS